MILGHEIWDVIVSTDGLAFQITEVFPYFMVGVLFAGYIRTYKFTVK